ncbi:hypothetical protein KBY85_15490 [Cyanobium sp. BA5m-10]|uniref:hypothetical protein n=1 Tax=Cyanobium sp. BA5m-10 TaxID=2823705 RepID=UPI0020CCC3BC|nr:hypothetical protein [Cyanobium sp. BA5m-10]MCP9905527.1 hypothetical protein [Cyanobium sp. BA5m-10]
MSPTKHELGIKSLICWSAGIFVFFQYSTTSAAMAATRDCKAALSSILSDIDSNKGALIAFVDENVIEGYDDNPFPRSKRIRIGLDGNAESARDPRRAQAIALNILSSPKLIDSYAKSLMKSCEDVSIVGIGIAKTGYWIDWFRFSDGSFRRKVCMSNPSSNGWGYGFCD